MANLVFSPAEIELINNKEWILTKNKLIANIELAFASVHTKQMLEVPASFLENNQIEKHYKISKGEKLKGLPWIMLDFPREFEKNGDHFSIRQLFWWGNHFSIHLHIAGTHLESRPELERGLRKLGWTGGRTNEPYIYDQEMLIEAKAPFLRLWKTLRLNQVHELEAFLLGNFRELIEKLQK